METEGVRGTRISLECPNCGTMAEQQMTPDEARETAGAILASADDMTTIRMAGECAVKGHG
jgi:hypothetical protein